MQNIKRTVRGVGYDSGGKYKKRIKNNYSHAYILWISMFKRVYCVKSLSTYPNYVGCTIDKRWQDYQGFAQWFYSNPFSSCGYHLDKDIISPGNKIYGPDFCAFVPQQINNLLLNRKRKRGPYPQGVRFRKDKNNYEARLSYGTGKNKHIGYFDNTFEAYNAYKIAKERHVKNTALKWANKIQWEVFVALMTWELPEYKDLKL